MRGTGGGSYAVAPVPRDRKSRGSAVAASARSVRPMASAVVMAASARWSSQATTRAAPAWAAGIAPATCCQAAVPPSAAIAE
ncbi:hypothetical protein AB0D14_19870 [Streptomyces sp. NPDC048484]|uniref:hypothetical protein n=1 Tax=Streptomyces sp. NPDC048484 TaxID=3155146 RepID=UPI0034390C4D